MSSTNNSAVKAAQTATTPVARGGTWITGLLLVGIGLLVLLRNLGVVEIHLVDALPLWPLLVILFGLTLVSVRGVFWRLFVIVFTVLTVGVIVAAATGYLVLDDSDKTKIVAEDVAQTDTTRRVDVSIRTGAGTLTLGAHTADEVIKTQLDSEMATLQQTSRQEDVKQVIEVATEPLGQWRIGDVRNDLSVTLNDRLRYAVMLEVGAARARLDMSEIHLTELAMKVGASRADVRFGGRVEQLTATIEAGASAVELELPAGSGVRLKLESGLAETSLADLEGAGGVYESPGYDDADQKIDLTVKIGAGSLKLVRY